MTTTLQEHIYLYVDDDMPSRVGMKMIFSRVLGIEGLTTFDESSNFLERVKALEPLPDVILLDIHIKPLNGFEMLALLRGDPMLQASLVIALTASVMNEEIATLRESGFNGTIAKPINVLNFQDLLARIIQGESIWHIA
jgi:CheY-like chemotaxis protein